MGPRTSKYDEYCGLGADSSSESLLVWTVLFEGISKLVLCGLAIQGACTCSE